MGWGTQEGKSVATMWGEMVSAAERGEVVAIQNKFGDDVAVMMGMKEYQRLIEAATGPEKVGD
jgi:hypothetical protein